MKNSLRAAAGAAPVLKPNAPEAPGFGVAGFTVSLRLPTGKLDSSWLRTKSNYLQQVVMLAQKFSVCGNLFKKISREL
jgi:hypothetical protein